MTYRIFCLLIIAFTVTVSCLIWGGYGLLGSCLIIVFSIPIWSSAYMNTRPLSLEKFKSDCVSLITAGFERIIVLSVFHILVGLNLGKLTLIPDSFLIYLTLAFLGYFFAYYKKKRKDLYWFSLGLFPLPFTLFLMLNYFISFNPTHETIKYTGYVTPASTGESDFFIIGIRIQLENQAYVQYPGIRSFLDRTEIEGNSITYTFKTGLFGVRVVHEREFSSVKRK